MASSTSQRISFVNKISCILKATSDDETPTAGYLYKEINDISFESVGYSESLVEFLVDRVKNKSCHVKFKVLKLMKYVVENGSREFQLGLKRHSDVIRECTKFGGPPHPMHGNVPYLMVRKIAKELCEALYNKDSMATKSPTEAGPDKPQENKYGGWGPVGPVPTSGAIQGFGNTPTSQSKGLGETILDGIEKLGAKMTESVADRQAALLAKLDLTSSTINYQPPVVMWGEEESTSTPTSVEERNRQPELPAKRPVKKHQPGKAGGGWGDDDDVDEDDGHKGEDNENNNDNGSKNQSMETDSLMDPANRLQSEEPQADWREESDLVADILRKGSTGMEKAYLSPSTITNFLSKCSTLSCDKIAELLGQKLSSQDAGVVIRTLQLLEGIIQNREELVGVDLLATTCKEALVNCYLNCPSQRQLKRQSEMLSASGNKELAEGKELPDAKIQLWGAAQTKSAKIILILQQLSSHKEILSTSHFSNYLTEVAPAPTTGAPVIVP